MIRIGQEYYSEDFIIEAVKAAEKAGISAEIKCESRQMVYVTCRTPYGVMMAYPSYENGDFPGVSLDLETPEGEIIGLSTTEVDTLNGDAIKAYLFEDGQTDEYTKEISYRNIWIKDAGFPYTQGVERKHCWEPVDNQGHSMECTACGEYIGIGTPEWSEKLDGPCPGRENGYWESRGKEGENPDA